VITDRWTVGWQIKSGNNFKWDTLGQIVALNRYSSAELTEINSTFGVAGVFIGI
jgi:hypothetical protein